MSEQAADLRSQPAGQHLAPYRFKPGQTGNPGGKRKGLNELHSLAVACYPEALRRLTELVNSKSEDTAKWAITMVLSYVLGKPTDSMAILEGLKARLGETFSTPLMAFAQQAPAVSLTRDEPQAPSLPPVRAPPETGSADEVPLAPDGPDVTPVLAPTAESLGFTMTPERAELLRMVGADGANPSPQDQQGASVPASPPSGVNPEPTPSSPLHCLYRTAQGPCGAPTDSQWCAVHKAQLFAQMGVK